MEEEKEKFQSQNTDPIGIVSFFFTDTVFVLLSFSLIAHLKVPTVVVCCCPVGDRGRREEDDDPTN